MPGSTLLRISWVVFLAIKTFCWAFTVCFISRMFSLTKVGTYLFPMAFILMMSKYLTCVTSQWIWYVERRRKATFSWFGKTDVLKVNTKVFVSFNASSRRTFILRTCMTPCSLISSRISSSLTHFKSGQRTTPLQVLREACKDTCTFRPWNVLKRNTFSICFLLVYSTSRSPERSFLYFLAQQPCQSRLSQLQKEKDLILTFLLVNE